MDKLYKVWGTVFHKHIFYLFIFLFCILGSWNLVFRGWSQILSLWIVLRDKTEMYQGVSRAQYKDLDQKYFTFYFVIQFWDNCFQSIFFGGGEGVMSSDIHEIYNCISDVIPPRINTLNIAIPIFTLVNVYVNLLVFTRIARTS